MDYAAEQLETKSLIKIMPLIVGCFQLSFYHLLRVLLLLWEQDLPYISCSCVIMFIS